jgi:hypothetical protein
LASFQTNLPGRFVVRDIRAKLSPFPSSRQCFLSRVFVISLIISPPKTNSSLKSQSSFYINTEIENQFIRFDGGLRT